ncbi:MAG: sulfurtransferase TusA [Gammaproteobacteria bacterium]|nr:sulfurtransferase TusA [Gammaproteobacteria bacterium]
MNEDTSEHYDHKLDTCGLNCPEPLMIVRNKVREMNAGERLLILATDPSTHRDFANFCRFMGHSLELAEIDPLIKKYIIRKG